MDAGQGELGGVPAPVEVGRKIRIVALLDGEEIEKNDVDERFFLKDQQRSAGDQRMCIVADLGGEGDEMTKKCLVVLNWNAAERTLHIFPDFCELNATPVLLEFAHPSGQMILYAVGVPPPKKTTEEKQLTRGIKQNNFTLHSFETPPDRNSYLSLLLFTFQTANDFDYDRLHFKYAIEHAPSRTNCHGATHTSRSSSTSAQGGTHFISHAFEVDLRVASAAEDDTIEVFVEAFSVDLWNRERYHGWSRLTIPTNVAGQFKRQLRFLRPVGTCKEALERFFIGGHKRPMRREGNSSSSNNLYGQRMEYSGTVEISYSMLIQRNQRMRMGDWKDEEGNGERGILNVDAVIEDFKKCCALVE